MADKVSKIDKNGVVTFYSTYLAARTASGNNPGDHDLIQILADLNEQIILKDKVDIWIMPGVSIILSSNIPTVTDNGVQCKCKIYGSGIIVNTNSASSTTNMACNFSNVNSDISIECDYIESSGIHLQQSSISSNASKFFLKCNKVHGKGNGAIFLNNNNSQIYIEVLQIETGLDYDEDTGTTAIVSRGNGFIKIDDILCRNLGHCLSHRAGEITAIIKKLTTINNRSNNISTVHLNQGTNDQKLILYFDEIQNLKGTANSLSAIELKQGTGIFIGRRIYSEDKDTVIIGKNTQTSDPPQKLSIRCDEINCLNEVALTINDSVQQTFIQANRIETSFIVVIFSNGGGNFVLKNPTVRNTSSSTDAIGIGVDTNQAIITLNNVKIIAGNSTSGRPITVGNSTQMNVYNYGVFSNAPINYSLALLKIGTSMNYFYIQSGDLT